MNIYTTTTFCFTILVMAIHLGESCRFGGYYRRDMDRSNTDDQISFESTGDGQIDVEEFGMMINTHADAIFDLLDQNQDGLISIAEFKSDLDLNDDGTISKDELMNDVEILASVLGLNLTL